MKSNQNNRIRRIAVGEVTSFLNDGYRFIGRVCKRGGESIFLHHLQNHSRVQIAMDDSHLQIIRDGVVVKSV